MNALYSRLNKSTPVKAKLTVSLPKTIISKLTACSSQKRITLNSEGNTNNKYSLKDFKFLETIGVGWLGKVDLTKWNNEPRAIKSVEKECAIKFNQVSHLINERQLLLTLNHPFIVKWYLLSLNE